MQENAEGDVQVGGTLPTQRTESALPPPGFSPVDETVILPAFLTGKKPSEPKPAEPARHLPAPSLPPSEKGMLIFVAALLGVGTVAVVALLGLGGLGHKASSQKPTVTSTTAVPNPGVVDSSSPSPSPSPSPTSSPSPTASPKRSPTPKKSTSLGTLGQADPYAYCVETKHSSAQPPDGNNPSWSCVSRSKITNFAPTDVCQWRFNDGTAYATVGTLSDPTSWRCYT